MMRRLKLSEGWNQYIRQGSVYPLVIALGGFCYYMSFFDYGINFLDEGFLVDGAERVLRGQLPMSHFIGYPPGRYIVLALLFKGFGVNLLVSRFMEIAFLLTNGVLVFSIARRLMPPKVALMPSLILMVFPGPWHKVFFTFGLLFPLCVLLRYLEKRTLTRLLTLGWVVGIALVFKIESGLFSLFTTTVVLFLDRIWKGGKVSFTKKTIKAFCRDIVLCSLALLSIVVPLLTYYFCKSSLMDLFHAVRETYGLDNVVTTTGYFKRPSLLKAVTTFQIGRLENFFFYLVLFLYCYLLRKVIIDLFWHKRNDIPPLLSVLIMGILSLTYAVASFGKSHLLQSLSVTYILFGFMMYSFFEKKEKRSKVMVVALVLLLGLYLLDNFTWNNHFYSGSIKRLYVIRKEGARLFRSERARIYITKGQLDRINGLLQFFEGPNSYLMPLVCAPMINFLTGLENPTRYSILFPSYFAQDPSRQEQVIESVKKHNIKYLLIHGYFWNRHDNFGLNSYAPKVWEFVVKHYRLEKEIGMYLIFSRRQ